MKCLSVFQLKEIFQLLRIYRTINDVYSKLLKHSSESFDNNQYFRSFSEFNGAQKGSRYLSWIKTNRCCFLLARLIYFLKGTKTIEATYELFSRCSFYQSNITHEEQINHTQFPQSAIKANAFENLLLSISFKKIKRHDKDQESLQRSQIRDIPSKLQNDL